MARGATTAVIAPPSPDTVTLPLLPWIAPENFSPGYLTRGMHLLPKRGDKPEWRHNQDYWAERGEEGGPLRFRPYIDPQPGEKVLIETFDAPDEVEGALARGTPVRQDAAGEAARQASLEALEVVRSQGLAVALTVLGLAMLAHPGRPRRKHRRSS